MKYQVLENDKPCDCFHHQVHSSWDKSTYDTLPEAIEYLFKWFNPYISLWYGGVGKVEYNQDCFAEIREIEL